MAIIDGFRPQTDHGRQCPVWRWQGCTARPSWRTPCWSRPNRRAGRAHPTPTQVRLWFNEEIEKDYASLTVLDAAQGPVTDIQPHIAADDRKAIVLPLSELAPGKYTVKFRVLSVDGHVVDSSYDFTVKSKTPAK